MSISDIKNRYKALSLPVKATLWYTICNVINKGLALLSTPIFTRIMTEEQYGTFSVFQSWYGILLIFTSLNVFLGGYQKGLITYKQDIRRFTSSQLGLTTTITIIVFIMFTMNVPFWSTTLDLEPKVMYAMFLELLFMPAVELWSAQQRFDYKYLSYVVLTMVMSIASILVGVISVVMASNKIEARVFSDVGVKAVFSGIIFLFIFLNGKCFYNRKYWKYSLAFNIPLIPHYLSNYVLNQSDRVMIGRMVGNSQAAYYSVAYTISTVMVLIINAINNSLTPYIYKSISSNENKKIKRATQPLVMLVAALCVLTMAFAPEVILIFAGKKYTDAIYVIPPVAASVFFIFLYSLFSTIEYYYQKTGFISIATCACAIINLILNYFFIKKYGYYAAGYTTLICYMFLAILHYLFYKRVLKQENIQENIYDLPLVVISSIIVILLMIIMASTYKFIWVRYILLMAICMGALVCKKKIKKIIMKFRKEEV